MNLERELRDLLRDRAGVVSVSAVLSHHTSRRARLQRALVATTGTLAVVLVAVGGFAVTGNLGVTRSVGPNEVGGSTPAPGEVARGTIGERSWVLSASTRDGALCTELSFESAGQGGVSVGAGGCAVTPAGPVIPDVAPPVLNVASTDYGEGPHRVVVYGDVGPEVNRVELRGDSALELALHDAPPDVDGERRFFIVFLPIKSLPLASFDRVVVVARDGSVLDQETFFYDQGPVLGQVGPTEIVAQGNVDNRNYHLSVSRTPDESCVSFEIAGLPGPGDGGRLCQEEPGATMTLVQEGFAHSPIAPVFGMLPKGADRVVLEIEGGGTVEGEVVPAPDGYPTDLYLLFAPSIESRGRVLALKGESRVPIDVIDLCLGERNTGSGGGSRAGADSASSCSSDPGP